MGSSDNLVISQHGQQGTEGEDPLKVDRLLNSRLNSQCPLSGPMRLYLSITVIRTIRLYSTVPFLVTILALKYI